MTVMIMMEFSCWKHIFVICYFDFTDSEVGVDSYNDVDDIYDNDDVWDDCISGNGGNTYMRVTYDDDQNRTTCEKKSVEKNCTHWIHFEKKSSALESHKPQSATSLWTCPTAHR